MSLPADVSPGVTTGHLAHHIALHTEQGSLPTSLNEGQLGHDTAHAALRTWHNAANPGAPLSALPARIDPAYGHAHELHHEALHAWRNSVNGGDPLPGLTRETPYYQPSYWSAFPQANASGWDDPTFFGISVFLGKPDHADVLHGLGINTYMGVEHDGTALTYITSRGMYVMAQRVDAGGTVEFVPAEVGSNNGVVGWFITDECDMGYGGCAPDGDQYDQLADQVAYCATVDGFHDNRFKWANFGNGILRTFWAPDTMEDHVALMDGASADKYTYTSPDVGNIVPDSPDWPTGATVARAASYGWQVDQMKSFQPTGERRPIWVFVETARPYLDEAGARTITPNQMEGAVWSGIIHGANGIAYFQHNNDPAYAGNYSLVDSSPPALTSKITAVNAKVTSLAPVLNSRTLLHNFTATGIDTMLKVYSGSIYIFAGVGLFGTTGSKTFTLPSGVTGTTVTVVGESRTITVSAGHFTDTFAAEYTHHVYQVTI